MLKQELLDNEPITDIKSVLFGDIINWTLWILHSYVEKELS